MTKLLWDDAYLRSFASNLLTTNISAQFWEMEQGADGEDAQHGNEVFAEVFYKEFRDAFPDESDGVTNTTLWNWMGEVGKAIKCYPNKHKNGCLDKQRLSPERWARWIAEGMGSWTDKNGKVREEGERVQVFKVSSMKAPETMFEAPDFSRETKVSEEDDFSIISFFEDK